MKLTLHHFCIVVFAFALVLPNDCFSQKRTKQVGRPAKRPDFTNAQKAGEESWFNRGFKQGKGEGYDAGFKDGEAAGRKDGYKDGYQTGYRDCMNAVGDSIYRTMSAMWRDPSHSDIGTMEIIRRDFEQSQRNRNHYRETALKEGMAKGYAEGYRDGLAMAFDSTYRGQLQRGANIAFRQPDSKYRFTLDYEKIARLLGDANGKQQAIEKKLFAEALHEVNIAVLEYLVQVERDTLTDEEAAEVFARYDEIHPALSEMCYRNYLLLCKTLNRNYDKNYFYDWQYSVSTEVFLDIVLFNIAAVADVTFTFAKSNTQFAAWEGFELGHIIEIIAAHVVVPLEEYFQKNAARIDFDRHFPQITPVTVALLSPIIADTRTHIKTVTEKIQLASEHTAWVTIEIETIVQLGYWLEDFNIVPDHRKQQVLVNVSNRPRLLRVVRQDYKVVEVSSDVNFGFRCSFSDLLSRGDLDAIFQKHRDPVGSLPICHAPLGGLAVDLIAPILTKIVEPAVAIPYSCYNVRLDFGGKTSNLIQVNCL